MPAMPSVRPGPPSRRRLGFRRRRASHSVRAERGSSPGRTAAWLLLCGALGSGLAPAARAQGLNLARPGTGWSDLTGYSAWPHAAAAAPRAEQFALQTAPGGGADPSGGGLQVEPERAPLWVPVLEIIGFDTALNLYNRRFSGTDDYDVSGSTIRRNWRGPWVTDNDPFQVNQFGHPYQGSLYHGAVRATGHGYWTAAAVTFVSSIGWEIAGERTPPSKNDQVASGIAGSFLGEPMYRMARLLRGGEANGWRTWVAAAVSPPDGLNHAIYGSRWDAAFDDHEPWYDGRLRLGGSRLITDKGGQRDTDRQAAELDLSFDYGLPGKPGYTYERPFDLFSVNLLLSSANGVEYLATRGLIGGATYANGDRDRPLHGVWGLWGSYDYVAPQIFNLSTTSLSVGTALRWQATDRTELQGTALGGVGYAAASVRRGPVDDAVERDFHYGFAPRVSLAGRAIWDQRLALELSSQQYWLGRIAHRSAGRDDVSRYDAALTWRVVGRHAIGVKAVWSRRETELPDTGDRTQSIANVGVYYTLLGGDGFGGGFEGRR